MPKNDQEEKPVEAGKQVPARPHDFGSQANETVDGLDANAEALRHAAEDTPSGAGGDTPEAFSQLSLPTNATTTSGTLDMLPSKCETL